CFPWSIMVGVAKPISLIPSWLTISILVSSSFSTSGGISSFFTSSSLTILGGVNLVISTFGGSCLGGGGGGGSIGFGSSSFIFCSTTSLTSSLASFLPFRLLARKEAPNAPSATAKVINKAVVILLEYVLRRL